jgi:pimeloyl-ACP methyl ester carboxylesterase
MMLAWRSYTANGMAIRILRDYFHHPQGELHYRHAIAAANFGETPRPIVLIHQSPQHSGALEAVMQSLAEHAPVYAPDMPGYGSSDAMQEPSITAFAERLAEFLSRCVQQPCVLFGQHTGALVAAAIAVRAPALVHGFVADGYPLFSPDENQALLANYFPDLTPRADGSHLITLWQRLQKQYRQFPWYAETGSGFTPWLKFNAPQPTPERLHQLLREVLQGEAPWRGYRGVFEFTEAAAQLHALSMPARLVYRAEDILAHHAPRLPADLPSHVQRVRGQGQQSWIEAILALCA